MLESIFDAESDIDRERERLFFFLTLWEEQLVSSKIIDTVMIYKIKVFCDVVLCWLVNSYILEERLHLQGLGVLED